LQQAWERELERRGSNPDPVFSVGLWPTWAAASKPELFARKLEAGSPSEGDDDIAKAHQWLYLNRPQRVWAVLHRYWQDQASPGLFTWSRGPAKNNFFSRWKWLRGWVHPVQTTPDYRSAAEMLLLQMEMLAYGKQSQDGPVLVVGAGVPRGWLSHSLRVDGLPWWGGQIGWQWDGKTVRVRYAGQEKFKVLLGPSFPSQTPVGIERF
jgi:hypothetical protein